MSPLILVGLFAFTFLNLSNADVKHVLEGSAHPPPCYPGDQNYYQGSGATFPSPGTFASQSGNYGGNVAASNAVPGSVAFWWADSNSPFKHAYDYFKKCSLKGNCYPPVVSPQGGGCDGNGCVVSTSVELKGVEYKPIDIKKNPFLNGQIQAVSTGCIGNACQKSVESGGTIDISRNPFLSQSSAISGTGHAVVTGSEGFLGVQPSVPFGKNLNEPRPFSTAHPVNQQGNQQFAATQYSSQGFPVSHPGVQTYSANYQETTGKFVDCKGADKLCVAPELCVGGVVNSQGVLNQQQNSVDYCEIGKEICCRLQGGSTILGSSSATFSTKTTGSTSYSSGSFPPIQYGYSNLSHVTAGKSSVPGSTIKFSGAAELSPSVIHVVQDNGAIPNPLISSAGETGSEVVHGAQISSNKVVRNTSPNPNSVFSSTIDYSNDKLDQLTFASTTQGPQYLPPVSSPKPPTSSYNDLKPPISTYQPSIPTTPAPLVTKPVIPGVSVVTPFIVSSPKPFEPELNVPQQIVPSYTPRPSFPSTPNQYLPPQTPSQTPFVSQSTYTTQKPYVPPVYQQPTTQKPYVPPVYQQPTTQKPYVPPVYQQPTTQKPYVPPVYQQSTTQKTYIPPVYQPQPTHPSTINRFTFTTPNPVTFSSTTQKIYVQPQSTPGYQYPQPTPPFNYPTTGTTQKPFIGQNTNIHNQYLTPKQPTFSPSTSSNQYIPPSSPTPGYQYPTPTPAFEYPNQPSPSTFRPSIVPDQTVNINNNYVTQKPPTFTHSTPKPTSYYPIPSSTSPPISYKPYNPQFTNGYSYPTPTPSFPTPTPTSNQYLPPTQPNLQPLESNTGNQYIPPPTTHNPIFPDETGNSFVSIPYAGCAAALKCVQEIYCTAEGFISPTPVVLTKEQELSRVPTTECADKEAGIIGRCCRDPNYIDPWPSANLINGFDNGQYREDKNLGQYFPQKQRPARSDFKPTIQNVVVPTNGFSAAASFAREVSVQNLDNFRANTCGIRNSNTSPRGESPIDVAFAEIPWQAMVLRDSNRSLLCGGVIVKSNAVLTAAHCVEGLETRDVLVKGGEWKLGIDEEPLPFQIVKVAAIIRHPAYRPGLLQNDLALLMLDDKLRNAKNVAPICLPAPDQQFGKQCIVTGWGKRILQVHLRGAIMRSIDVNFLDGERCYEKLTTSYPHVLSHFAQTTVCGYSHNDQCDVDYGSALACSNGDGQYTLAGIFSWDTGCKDPEQIGAYILPDLEWIESTCSTPLTHLKALDKQYRNQ